MRPRASGFTLLELLVALFVTAVMFAIGYGAITQALENRERVQVQQRRLNELQRAMRTLVQDFAQAVPRPVRDALGSGEEAAFVADPRVTGLVALTRAGYGNVAGAQRPALQRVEYLVEGDALLRITWPVLDRSQSTPAQRRVLLRGLRGARLRYLDVTGEWLPQWPPPTSSLPPQRRQRLRPLAVEITLDTEDFGPLVRIVEVPG
jgi:general secretion pathway protein J